MQSHWKGLLLFNAIALTAFIIVMMYDLYVVGIGLLLAAFLLSGMYLIGMARFRNRPDAPDEQRHGPAH